MAIPELVHALERAADGERAEIEEDARSRAEAVVAAARAECDRRRTEAIERYRAEARRRLETEVAEAGRNARREVLAARAAMLERLRAEVERVLPEAGGDRTAELVRRLVAGALAHLGDDVVVRCREDLALLVRAAAPAAGLEIDPSVRTGVVARDRDGRVTVDARLEALLDQAWPELAMQAAAAVAEEATT